VMNAIREGTRSEDIMQYAQEVSEKNSEIAKEVDKICLSRNKYEQDFMEMSSDIDSFYKQAETIIGISDSTKLEKFLIMRESLSDVERDLEEDKLQIQKLSHEIGQKQIETRGQHTRTEYKVLEKRLASLEVEMQQLIVEQEILNMSSSEAQNFQLQKLKESQKTMAELDVTRDNLQEQIAEMQEKLRSFEKDMALLDGPSTAQMDSNQLIEGIRSSEMTLEESTQEAAKIDTSIKQLELRVTELLSEQENIPTKQELKDMKTEVILRNDEVTNCHQTIEILKSEHDRRVQEWETIQNLEETVKGKISNLRSTIENMKSGIEKFSDIPVLHKKAREAKEYLSSVLESCKTRKKDVEEQFELISSALDHERTELEKHPDWRRLRHLEQRIVQQQQTLHALQEDIILKSRQTNFTLEKRICIELAESINEKILQCQ